MMWQISLLSYFQKLRYPPKPSAATTLISQQLQTLRQDRPPAKNMLTHWRFRGCSTYFILETKCCVLRSGHCLFRHEGIAHLTDFRVNTILCAVEMKKICVIAFIVKFTLLPWSGTQPTVSLRLASIYMALVYVSQPGSNTWMAAQQGEHMTYCWDMVKYTFKIPENLRITSQLDCMLLQE